MILRDLIQELLPGKLVCHVFGKSGETFFASGFLPEIRRHAPGVPIVYKVLEPYAQILKHCEGLEVRTYPRRRQMSLCDDVNGLIWDMQKRMEKEEFEVEDGELHLSMYRYNLSHQDYEHPFYQQNMLSLGLDPNGFERPKWPAAAEAKIALVLPSGNVQSGIGMLPLIPSDWFKMARELRSRGLIPTACFHPEDPRADMPGWEIVASEGPAHVLDLCAASKIVVGINSGMTFASLCLSPGRVTMLNQHPYGYYYFAAMPQVVDPARHRQVEIKVKDPRAKLLPLVREGFGLR